jgi:hypothetical protein
MGADAERGRTVTLGLRTTGFVIAVASVLSLSSASALPVPDAATSRYTADGSNLGPRAGYGDKPRWGDVDPPVGGPGVSAPQEQPVVPVARNVRMAELSIPATVLAAYQQAADRMAVEDPSCGLRWQILAGIGKIESGHARGGRVTASGDAVPRILGPVLDGSGYFAAIGDHDGGRWDGDRVWDRAVGPMQFIPGTWAVFGADGSGDGVADPNNVFDATLSAGRYLCAGSADLTTEAGLRAALRRYNNSAAYVAHVLGWIYAYDAGVGVPVDGAGPGDETVSAAAGPSSGPSASPSMTASPTPSATASPSPTMTASPSPSPTSPTPTPTTWPSPTPTASPSPSPTDSPSPSECPTPSPTPTESPTPTPTPSPSPTACPTPTP